MDPNICLYSEPEIDVIELTMKFSGGPLVPKSLFSICAFLKIKILTLNKTQPVQGDVKNLKKGGPLTQWKARLARDLRVVSSSTSIYCFFTVKPPPFAKRINLQAMVVYVCLRIKVSCRFQKMKFLVSLTNSVSTNFCCLHVFDIVFRCFVVFPKKSLIKTNSYLFSTSSNVLWFKYFSLEISLS